MRRTFLLFIILLLLPSLESSSLAVLTPEKETLRISKLLKPIPDNQWQVIAGEKVSEKYGITPGDTLYDISKRLFGDPKYWPKIWALNNGSITNPHLIRPGNTIAFLPGTGTSLPTVSIAEGSSETHHAEKTATDASHGVTISEDELGPRSSEWKHLPIQRWEASQIRLPQGVDALGFDNRNKVKTEFRGSRELPFLAATDELPPVGKIVGARTPASFLGLGDTVFIHSKDELQVGETYAITTHPQKIKGQETGRSGYSYSLLGRVRIVSLRDEVYVGVLTSVRGFVQRGYFLLPNPARVPELTPIPGPSSMTASLTLDRQSSTFATAQGKFAYVDRGSEDGIKPGMVFRAFHHIDPNNSKRNMAADLLDDADLMVLQVSEGFSLTVLINSTLPIYENAPLTLLTDVTDLLDGTAQQENLLNEEKPEEMDELDKLDRGEGIGKKEAEELKQLEKWQKGQDEEAPAEEAKEGTPETSPSPSPSPTQDAQTSEPTPTPEASGAPPAGTPAPEPTPTPTPTPTPSPTPEATLPPPPPEEPEDVQLNF